jgi:hypothetical protein
MYSHCLLNASESSVRLSEKPFLPHRSPEAQLFARPKGESSFDELNSAFNCHVRREADQNMEMIGHDHKFMKKILALLAVMVQDVHEQSGTAFRLQEVAPSGYRRSHKEGSRRGDDVLGRGMT